MIAYRRGVQDGLMANRHILADNEREAVRMAAAGARDMYHGGILDVAARTDVDCLHVAASYDIGPERCVLGDRHATDHDRGFIDERRGRDERPMSFERTDGHGGIQLLSGKLARMITQRRTTMQVGVIGLGAMGGPMAENLRRAGSLHRVWNRNPERLAAFIARTGAIAATDPATLARDCDLVLTCVSRDGDVLEVIETIAPQLAAGNAVVDTSTVSADTARTAAKLLAARGVTFLDAPVSGGVEGARQGTLAMMVGGDPAVLDRLRPTLDAIAKRVVHMGPVGSGQATKAVNQIMVAGIAQGVAGALGFGRRMELDLDKVLDVVARGAAANWFLDHRGPTMIRGEFQPGFKLSLHLKDLRICRDMLRASGSSEELSVIEATIDDYERLVARRHGDEDISALFRLR